MNFSKDCQKVHNLSKDCRKKNMSVPDLQRKHSQSITKKVQNSSKDCDNKCECCQKIMVKIKIKSNNHS